MTKSAYLCTFTYLTVIQFERELHRDVFDFGSNDNNTVRPLFARRQTLS